MTKDSEDTWKRLDAIVADIEWLDKATGGAYRQAEDLEALRIVTRIERKLRRKRKAK
jgi:hypothetical protein